MTDFERWWYDEGSANRPVDEDIEEFAKRMCQIAWSNGAFVEREACKKAADDQWVRNPNVSGGDAIQVRGQHGT